MKVQKNFVLDKKSVRFGCDNTLESFVNCCQLHYIIFSFYSMWSSLKTKFPQAPKFAAAYSCTYPLTTA